MMTTAALTALRTSGLIAELPANAAILKVLFSLFSIEGDAGMSRIELSRASGVDYTSGVARATDYLDTIGLARRGEDDAWQIAAINRPEVASAVIHRIRELAKHLEKSGLNFSSHSATTAMRDWSRTTRTPDPFAVGSGKK